MMRRLALLLLTSLVLAGCTGTEEPPPPATNNTTTTTTPTLPTVAAPKDVCTGNKDFSQQVPDPTTQTAVSTSACAGVPAGYGTITLNVTYTLTGPALLTQGVTVRLLDAAKQPVATCPTLQAGDQAPKPCVAVGMNPIAGDYTLRYEGTGNVAAKVTVTVA